MTDKVIEIFTDGACLRNPDPGGWGTLLKYGNQDKELFGGENDTTNNRMELMAAIQALESLSCDCTVKITTDSVYVKNGITAWKKRGWRTTNKKLVKNVDLWKRLDAAAQKHMVS